MESYFFQITQVKRAKRWILILKCPCCSIGKSYIDKSESKERQRKYLKKIQMNIIKLDPWINRLLVICPNKVNPKLKMNISKKRNKLKMNIKRENSILDQLIGVATFLNLKNLNSGLEVLQGFTKE